MKEYQITQESDYTGSGGNVKVRRLFQDMADNGMFIEAVTLPKAWEELAQVLKHAMKLSGEGEELWKAILFGYPFHPELRKFFTPKELADAISFLETQTELLIDKTQLRIALTRYGF